MSKVLRVALVWHGTVMQEETLRRGRSVTVGDSRAATFKAPVGASEADHELFQASGGSYTLVTSPGMTGRVVVGGAEKNVQGAGSFSVSEGDWGVVNVGDVAFYFQWVDDDAAIAGTGVLSAIEFNSLNSVAASFFAHAVFLLFVLSFVPDLSRDFEPEIDDRFARLLAEMPPDAIEEVEELDMPDDESTSAAAGGEEGKFGAEDAEVEDSVLPDHDGPLVEELTTPELGRAMNSAIGASGALTSVFGNSDAFSNNFGMDFATAGEGDAFVLGRGVGGLGVRGTGRGGGGDGPGRVHGVGSIDTGSGRGQGASLGDRGERVREPRVSRGRPQANGYCAREDIERVVRRHTRGIQYCYERELQNDSELSGRVTLNWTIDLDGRVQSASVTENSMGSRNVESCILAEARRMRFAEPDGGMCVVSFPFTFRSE